MTQGAAAVVVDCPKASTQQVPLSQEREVLSVPHAGSDSGEPGQVLTDERTTVGIMVFSASCTMLYANQAAFHFLTLLNYRETGHATPGALPASIADLFDQVRLAISSRMIMSGACNLFEARRVLMGQDQAVFLQAFGLPGRLETQGLRVVVTMEGVIPSTADSSGDAIPISI